MTQFVSMRNHRASTRLARPTRSGANLGIDIFKGPRLMHRDAPVRILVPAHGKSRSVAPGRRGPPNRKQLPRAVRGETFEPWRN